MVRQDIVTAIRNAVERGASLEKARQVLINSGYGINDINEAMNYLTGGIVNTPQPIISQPIEQPVIEQPRLSQTNEWGNSSQSPQQVYSQKLPTQQPTQLLGNKLKDANPKVKKNFNLIILLGGLLAVLFIALILIFIFQDKVVNFFQGLMG